MDNEPSGVARKVSRSLLGSREKFDEIYRKGNQVVMADKDLMEDLETMKALTKNQHECE